MAGNKETKELAIAMVVVGLVVAAKFKDGFQFQDVIDVYNEVTSNPELLNLIGQAYDKIGEIPAEIADLNFLEIFDIVSAVIKEFNK